MASLSRYDKVKAVGKYAASLLMIVHRTTMPVLP